MGKLLNIARNTLGAGGEYISLDDIIRTYPAGVTINNAFKINPKKGDKITHFFLREYLENGQVKCKGEYPPTDDKNNVIPVQPDANCKIPCFTFEEDAEKFFWAVSGDLAKLFDKMLNSYGNSIEELAESLQYENIKLRIWRIKPNSGNRYTKATVVGSVEKPRVEYEEEVAEKVDAETGEILNGNAPF